MKKNLKKKKGFTLIELIIVMAILGILAAIAIPRIGGFRKSAQVTADKATATTIEKAAEMLHASNNGKFPAAVAASAYLTSAAVAQGESISAADGLDIVAACLGQNLITTTDVAGLTDVNITWDANGAGDATVTVVR